MLQDNKYFKAFETDKENWGSFDIIEDYKELSDFHVWAISKAFHTINQGSRFNMWYWSDSNLVGEDKFGNTFYFGMTTNGIFVCREYNAEGEQVAQYRISML